MNKLKPKIDPDSVRGADVKDYLASGIASFGPDPADSDYQRGYQAALEDIHDDLFLTAAERAQKRAPSAA